MMIPGIMARRRGAAAAKAGLPLITGLNSHTAQFSSASILSVRGFQFSTDGTKGILCGFSGAGVETLALPTPGRLFGATSESFWSSATTVLSAAAYGDGTRALVTHNSPWRLVRYSLSSAWNFAAPVQQAEVTALNGKSAGSVIVLDDGLRMIHYGFDLTWAALYTLPTPGAIESATLVYSVNLAPLLALGTGENFAGMLMAENGLSAWLTTGHFGDNNLGELRQLSMSSAYDLRTASLVRADNVPSGLFPAGHPIGWHAATGKLVLCHQSGASQLVREYTPTLA